jgi:hypothetical protein
MSKTHLSPELSTLLQLSAPSASEIEFEAILRSLTATFNWNYFLERAIATNLAGYLLPYPELAQKHYPTQIYHKIKSYQQKILLHSVQLLEVVKILHIALDEQLIDHAILKGCSLLIRKEANPKKRQVSDIDLLIDPTKQQEVLELFKRIGVHVKPFIYKSEWHQNQQLEHAPIQAVFMGLSLDIHTRLFRSDTGYEIVSSQLLAQVVYFDFEDQKIPLLADHQAQLFTILHAHKHLYHGVAFKVGSINDLFLLNWHELKPYAKKWNAIQAFEEMELFANTWFKQHYTHSFNGKTALRFVSNRKMTLVEKSIFLYRRLTASGRHVLHPKHYFYTLFPIKTYLNYNFGKGVYLAVWWRRIKNLFRF